MKTEATMADAAEVVGGSSVTMIAGAEVVMWIEKHTSEFGTRRPTIVVQVTGRYRAGHVALHEIAAEVERFAMHARPEPRFVVETTRLGVERGNTSRATVYLELVDDTDQEYEQGLQILTAAVATVGACPRR
jgi:hypothetical protein